MTRSRLQLRSPWNLALAALAFLALDALVFKSGLYAHLASPNSLPGALARLVHLETKRPHNKSLPEALILGDSKIAEGFSPGVAESWAPHAPLKLIAGAVPGISLRGIYYLLRRIDRTHDRYRMLVVPLYFYTEYPLDDQLETRLLDADMLSPVLGWHDELDFTRNFPTTALRGKALVGGLVGSAYFAADVRDLLSHPLQRLQDVVWYRKAGDRVPYRYEGRAEDMLGLAFDPKTHTIEYPPRLTAAQRAATAAYFTPRPLPEAAANAAAAGAYIRHWTQRLVDDYRHTSTTIVFICMPRGPLPLPRMEPQPDAPSLVAQFADEPGVAVVDAQTFATLARPQYYFDMLHLNAAGRVAFSRKLVDALLHLLPSSPTGAR